MHRRARLANESSGIFKSCQPSYLSRRFSFWVQISEDRDVRRRQWLLTERGFRAFIHSGQFAAALQEDGRGISFLPDLISIERIAHAIEDFGNLTDEFTAQELAELTAEKLVARGLAEKEDGAFLSPTYRLVDSLAEELLIGVA